jgi:hypothetical protein
LNFEKGGKQLENLEKNLGARVIEIPANSIEDPNCDHSGET